MPFASNRGGHHKLVWTPPLPGLWDDPPSPRPPWAGENTTADFIEWAQWCKENAMQIGITTTTSLATFYNPFTGLPPTTHRTHPLPMRPMHHPPKLTSHPLKQATMSWWKHHHQFHEMGPMTQGKYNMSRCNHYCPLACHHPLKPTQLLPFKRESHSHYKPHSRGINEPLPLWALWGKGNPPWASVTTTTGFTGCSPPLWASWAGENITYFYRLCT